MKKTLFTYSLPVLMVLTCTVARGQWAKVGNAGISADAVYGQSIAMSNNGTPYIVYKDDNKSGKTTVKKYNGSNWVTVGSAGFSAGGAFYVDIAFDSNDTPYVAYRDIGSGFKATVMKYNGSSWVTVGSAGFSNGDAYLISLAFDSNDTLYISYMDFANSKKATVEKFNGSSWTVVGSAGFSAGSAEYITMAIDGNDNPHVAFRDGNNSDKVTVMKYNGSSWTVVGSAGFSAGDVTYTDIAFDSNDTPYVAYRDFGKSGKASVMKYNGSSWVNVGSAGFSASSADYTSLSIDGNDKPYVAYRDFGNSGKATVMKYNGSSWVVVGSAGFSASGASYFSSSFDDNDVLHIGFTDASKSDKATVMKYVQNTWNGSGWSDGTPDSTLDAYIASATAPASFTCKDLYINDGATLNTGTSSTTTIYGDLTNNGNGVSGQGTLNFTASDSVEITGDTVEHEGTVIVESGCTLTTNSLLRLTSDASNTGRIGESDGTISGNVYVQRYMPGKRCFRFYGHPFSSSIPLSQLTDEIDITGSGGASNGFTTTGSNNPSAFYFDVDSADNSTGVNPGWQPFTSANSADWDQYELLRLLVRGAKGEGLTGGSYTPSAATFEAVGVVNQGTQVITLTKGSNSTFVGCGNPFPSPVEMDKVTVGSNVGANYYAWDATSGASGAYVTNAWTLPYDLPAYAAFFTNVSANSNNTLTFEEADKVATSASLFKTTSAENWVELYIYDSTTKWDRLLINFNTNGMEVEDQLDGKKLYNPNLDFFTLSKDDTRLAVDVRPYDDGKSIPLGLTAYNRYNKYVIKTGMFDVPAGTKLILYDKYTNEKHELKAGFEYWFDVTSDSLTQGNNRFEINMVGKPSSVIEAAVTEPAIQLIPNPARDEVKVSFKAVEGDAYISIVSITGQVFYNKAVTASEGSVVITLTNMPSGLYLVNMKGNNINFTEKLIKE